MTADNLTDRTEGSKGSWEETALDIAPGKTIYFVKVTAPGGSVFFGYLETFMGKGLGVKVPLKQEFNSEFWSQQSLVVVNELEFARRQAAIATHNRGQLPKPEDLDDIYKIFGLTPSQDGMDPAIRIWQYGENNTELDISYKRPVTTDDNVLRLKEVCDSRVQQAITEEIKALFTP